jgi:pimeloyl-ACP methyl ester carboxylesterase
MRTMLAISLAVAVILTAAPAASGRQDALPRKGKPEAMEGVETIYGSVAVDGYRVRTILTRPKGATGRLPGLFLVPWLSCDTSEVPAGETGGSDQLLRGLVTRSGYAVMRVDRPGLGDSEGPPCARNDFLTDLRAYRAALRAFARSEHVDPSRLFMLGVSNGGGVAPLVAGGEDPVRVAGYVVAGGWAKTWLEHMLYHERLRLTLKGDSQAEVARQMRLFAEFHERYLNGKMTPAEVARERPHLAGLWYDEPDSQYGRPAAFYHQLHALDLAAAWAEVDAPTLAVWGEYDWIMSREDHELIVDLVNRKRPGAARLVVVPKMDHFFMTAETMEASFHRRGPRAFASGALDAILEWLKSQK